MKIKNKDIRAAALLRKNILPLTLLFEPDPVKLTNEKKKLSSEGLVSEG